MANGGPWSSRTPPFFDASSRFSRQIRACQRPGAGLRTGGSFKSAENDDGLEMMRVHDWRKPELVGKRWTGPKVARGAVAQDVVPRRDTMGQLLVILWLCWLDVFSAAPDQIRSPLLTQRREFRSGADANLC